jgi:transposase
VADDDIYICPAGKKHAHHFTNEEDGLVLRRYWTNACRTCALKAQCTKEPQRRITRWEHEYVVDAVQARLGNIRMRCLRAARRPSIRLAR